MRFTTLAVTVFGIVALVNVISFLVMIKHFPTSKQNGLDGKPTNNDDNTEIDPALRPVKEQSTLRPHSVSPPPTKPKPKPKPAPTTTRKQPSATTTTPPPAETKKSNNATEPHPVKIDFPPRDSTKPIPILWWEAAAVGFLGGHSVQMPEPCPVKCEYHTDRSRLDQSDGVIFHLPTFSDFPPHKNPNHVWIMLCMEGVDNYPRLGDKSFMNQFDMHMNYYLDSDIVTGYWSGIRDEWFTPPVKKDQDALAVFVASNCGPRNGRNEYVAGLMNAGIKVHSYGACLRNKEFNVSDSHSPRAKLEVIRRYKFYLAFENSNSVDYVSEKMFQALYMGVVPIYMGAPNVDEFLPDPMAAIKVTDFSGPEELARYLKYLDENEDAYQKHLAWKYKPASPRLEAMLNMLKWDTRCELCVRLHKRRELGYMPHYERLRKPPSEPFKLKKPWDTNFGKDAGY